MNEIFMAKLIDLLPPYDSEDVLFNEHKDTQDRDNFFRNADLQGLTPIFQAIQVNMNNMCQAAYNKSIDCYLKLHGFKSVDVKEKSGEFIGVYLGILSPNKSFKTDGKPNTLAGGKLMGIDISKNTINFQLFAYDSEDKVHSVLRGTSGSFPMIDGSQRIPLEMKNIQVINERLIAMCDYLKNS